ncbi:hypothetical protein EG327_010874 [Venturia inaequalis]|uniref:Uncharacterized protein n=1 Tax=Venturia inaequalis TaxID=5025 RepID=A0A8H3YR55_VENIN|nr:hypothetical protein EG327_010874 [Venturia inaequalis]
MRLQTLVPAILFAQSTLAFNCCMQIRSKSGINKASNIYSSADNKLWEPSPAIDCTLVIYKDGNSCATWKSKIAVGCDLFKPVGFIGAVDGKECQI